MVSKNEKVNASPAADSENGEQIIEELPGMIFERLEEFFGRYHIADPMRMPSNTFFLALKYAGQVIPETYKYKSLRPLVWDRDHVEKLAGLYVDLCGLYDKPVSVIGFGSFSGLPDRIFYAWESGTLRANDESNAAAVALFQGMEHRRRESLTNKAIDGKGAVVGVLAVLNHEFNYGSPAIEKVRHDCITADEIAEKIGLSIGNSNKPAEYALPDVEND